MLNHLRNMDVLNKNDLKIIPIPFILFICGCQYFFNV